MDHALFQKLSKRIDGYRNDMIDMQKKLISMPAISPLSGGKGEYQRGKYLEPILAKIFDTVTACPATHPEAEGGIRPNYACILKGKKTDRTTWLMAHLDVVPEGERNLWDTNPFEAVVKDGRIYGRGSEDNQQAIISGLFACKALKDEGVVPEYNVGLLLVADEENGNTYGAEHILKNHANLFTKKDSVIIPDSGVPEGDELEVAEKTTLWIKTTVKGKQAHAAYPNLGINTMRISAHIIAAVDEMLHKTFPETNPVFTPDATSTFEPTKKLQNVANVNTIPGEDVFFFDCRIIPAIPYEKVLNAFKMTATEIARKFGGTVEFEIAHLEVAAPPTSVNEPIVQNVLAGIKEVYNIVPRPMGTGGNTVGQAFRKFGLPCVVYSRLDCTLHKPNEYVVIDYMVGDTKIWAHAFLAM